jgi:exodeoxyribonuclease VII large subunit
MTTERVLRVLELNRIAKLALEEGFPDVWVEGELGDVVRAASGHLYFTLNDGQDPAQIRGVMFRGDARRSRARFVNGEKVRLRGGLTLYEARGHYQIVARIALPAGEGDAHAELARLREKLAKEGLFDPSRKRRLPRLPATVGVVTSLSGAAVHDVLEVARGRCPTRIVIAHCLVQGPEAPGSIVRALAAIQKLPELDVVIVGRGGGGAEDLVAFQDERVARAIAACRVPVVSAVGHEVDVTIADLVADVRAATPSNAAELVVPDRRALLAELEAKVRGMERALDARLDRARVRLERLTRRVADPRRALGRGRQRLFALDAALTQRVRRKQGRARDQLDALTRRLAKLDARTRLARDRARLAQLTERLRRVDARARLAVARRRLDALDARLAHAAEQLVERRREALHRATTQLRALSPLEVLSRGYAIALDAETGRALVDARTVTPGAAVRIRLARGALDARVETTHAGPEPTSSGDVEAPKT